MCFIKTGAGFVKNRITCLKSNFPYDKSNFSFVISRIGFSKRKLIFVTELSFLSKTWVCCSPQ
jgi:hypothetical protein